MENRVRRIADALLFSAIGFCIAMWIGDAMDWGEIDVSWETLIAGAGAVAAAYLTVAQMRSSDRRADRRHSDNAVRELQHKKAAAEVIQALTNDYSRAARNISLQWEYNEQEERIEISRKAEFIESNVESMYFALYSNQMRNSIHQLDASVQVALARCQQTAGHIVNASKTLSKAARSKVESAEMKELIHEMVEECRKLSISFSIYWSTLRDSVREMIVKLEREMGAHQPLPSGAGNKMRAGAGPETSIV